MVLASGDKCDLTGLAPRREERKTGVYTKVNEDLSTTATQEINLLNYLWWRTGRA